MSTLSYEVTDGVLTREVNKPNSADKDNVMIQLSFKIHPVNALWRMPLVYQIGINMPPHSYLKPKMWGVRGLGPWIRVLMFWSVVIHCQTCKMCFEDASMSLV